MKRRMPPENRGQGAGDKGFALLVVLWSLVLISLLTAQILASGRTAMALADNVRAGAALRARADGAINEALFHLLSGGTAHWPPDGSEHLLNAGGVPVAVKIRLLDNKINPNLASTALLAGLFQACGAARAQAFQLADAVVQWRSQAVSQQAGQSEIAQYKQAGLPFGPPGQPFNDTSEMAYVIGMPPGLLARAEPYMSLYQAGDPNPEDSDAVVRQALTLAGQTGVSSTGYASTQPVVSITATAQGAGGLAVHRVAIIGIATGDGPYQFLSLTDGH